MATDDLRGMGRTPDYKAAFMAQLAEGHQTYVTTQTTRSPGTNAVRVNAYS